jgi:hypothetical protein
MATARKKEKRLKCGASSGHITNLKQSIFSFDIYGDKHQMIFLLVWKELDMPMIFIDLNSVLSRVTRLGDFFVHWATYGNSF